MFLEKKLYHYKSIDFNNANVFFKITHMNAKKVNNITENLKYLGIDE